MDYDAQFLPFSRSVSRGNGPTASARRLALFAGIDPISGLSLSSAHSPVSCLRFTTSPLNSRLMNRIAATTCALLACACVLALGQESPVRPRPVSLLVLKNGRVVDGRITPRPGGYDVVKGLGRMYVASETVRFEARDLADAYRKLRSTYTEFTPAVHLQIARWCIANNQVNSARQELLDALHLEPNNTIARAMLKRLEAQATAQTKTPVKTIAERRMDQFLRTDHESLGGLTDPQAAAFVSRVQPILERRCGNSSCHGSASPSDFVLTRTRGRSSQLVAQRNLAAVLKQVDLANPGESPLLRVMETPHTRDGRPVMPGRAGRIQKQIIVDWVNSLAAAESPSTPQTAAKAVARTASSGRRQPSASPRAPVKQLTPPAPTVRPEDQKLLEKIRRSNADDPFDPAEFNRKHHGFQKRGGRATDGTSSPRS